MGEWWAVLKVFGTAIGGIIVWILGSKIFEATAPKILDRYFQRKDKQQQLHDTNQAAQIEFDKLTFIKTIERLEKLEEKFEKLQEKHNSLMVENATFKIENEHLREHEKSQAEEIRKLRESNRKLLESDRDKDLKIQKLESELATALKQIEILGNKIDSLEKKK